MSGAGGGSGVVGAGKPALWGLATQFDTVEELLAAAEMVRDAGFSRWDSYAPFPVHGLNDAMGIRHTRLPLLVLGAGIMGAGLSLLMQWWMNSIDYPLIISGKPFFGLPPSIPIAFEITVLLSALATFVGVIAFNNLPMWNHPIFGARSYKRVTTDRFMICIEAADPKFREDETRTFLEGLGGSPIERVEE